MLKLLIVLQAVTQLKFFNNTDESQKSLNFFLFIFIKNVNTDKKRIIFFKRRIPDTGLLDFV